LNRLVEELQADVYQWEAGEFDPLAGYADTVRATPGNRLPSGL
jgi:hypothetical protein